MCRGQGHRKLKEKMLIKSLEKFVRNKRHTDNTDSANVCKTWPVASDWLLAISKQPTSYPLSLSVHHLSINPFSRPVIYQKGYQTNRLIILLAIQSKYHSACH